MVLLPVPVRTTTFANFARRRKPRHGLYLGEAVAVTRVAGDNAFDVDDPAGGHRVASCQVLFNPWRRPVPR